MNRDRPFAILEFERSLGMRKRHLCGPIGPSTMYSLGRKLTSGQRPPMLVSDRQLLFSRLLRENILVGEFLRNMGGVHYAQKFGY